jgi:hypothetical protein
LGIIYDGVVGKDADDVGTALDLLANPIERVGNWSEVSGAPFRPSVFFGGLCRENPGRRLRGYEVAGRPVHRMGFERASVAGRL